MDAVAFMETAFVDALSRPWLIPVVLFFGTFVLEDAAIVTGAMFATAGRVEPELAFVALLLGIVVGDLGLYFLGKLVNRFAFIQRWMERERIQIVRHWVSGNLFQVIFLVRFAPGLRLPCYVSCGMFTVSLSRFVLAVGVAGGCWVALTFGGLHWFGRLLSVASFWQDAGVWKWGLVPALAIVLFYGQRLLNGRIRSYLENRDDR